MNQTLTADWTALGLEPLDERVYRCLLDHAGTAPAVSDKIGISVDRTRRSLQRLVAAGLAMPGDGRSYVASPPQSAIARLVAEVQTDLAHVSVVASELQADYETRQMESGAAEVVEVIAGQDRITRRFAQLISTATEEVMAFVSPPFLAPGDFSEDEHGQLTSGVAYRVVYDEAGVDAQGGVTELLSYVDAGEQARVTGQIPVKMFLIDGRHALVPLSLDVGPAAVLIGGRGLLDALVALFELVWESAWPLRDYRPGGQRLVLSEPDRRLVGLMRSGSTDAKMARHLGVTPRTISRRLARLMSATGCTTRFQLGWRMAELERE